MPNTAPFEVIMNAPFSIYRAPVGTAAPDLTAEVSTIPAWVIVGKSGPLNYDRDTGLMVSHRQTLAPWRSLGDSGVRKVGRTEEDQVIRISLIDLSPEQYALGLNDNEVRTTGSIKRLGLSRGQTVATHALLIRGDISPLSETGKMQYVVPRATQQGSPEVVYKNGVAAGIALEWMTLVDPDAARPDEYFGYLEIQS